jgi:hypothetical protein
LTESEDAAQVLYRNAHTQGTLDTLNYVLEILRAQEWEERGTSFDTIKQAIRTVEGIRLGHVQFSRTQVADKVRERAYREKVLGMWPPIRTEEEIRKDRLYAEKRYGHGS